MQEVGAFILKKPGSRKRLLCYSAELQGHIWPYTFTQFMPSARPMCRWASRNGAMIHPSMRLVARDSKGVGVVTLRALPAGTQIMSVPLKLALASSNEDRETLFLGVSNPREQLCHMFVRGLVDPTCQWKSYLEFLHDTHNMDNDESDILGNNAALLDAVDEAMDGNALVVSGVPNAPFMDRGALTQAKHRVQWVRWQQAKRELEQAVPHYAAQAAAWSISMILSRSMPCPEELCDSNTQEHMVVPMIDFLNHNGRSPSAKCVFTHPPRSGASWKHVPPRGTGVLNYDRSEGHAHIVAARDVRAGEEITLSYSDEKDPEHWLLNWGFIPEELQPPSKRTKKLRR